MAGCSSQQAWCKKTHVFPTRWTGPLVEVDLSPQTIDIPTINQSYSIIINTQLEGWCPLFISWFITPIDYFNIDHKP